MINNVGFTVCIHDDVVDLANLLGFLGSAVVDRFTNNVAGKVPLGPWVGVDCCDWSFDSSGFCGPRC